MRACRVSGNLHERAFDLSHQRLASIPRRPFTAEDKSALQFLYDEWAHPFFISKASPDHG